MAGIHSLRVLVTGGAGYIGSVAVDSLIAEGHEVAVFDNLYMGHRVAVNEQALFVEGDLANKSEIDAVMGDFKPDSIMHFAAYTIVPESVEDPLKYYYNNTCSSRNLLDSTTQQRLFRPRSNLHPSIFFSFVSFSQAALVWGKALWSWKFPRPRKEVLRLFGPLPS